MKLLAVDGNSIVNRAFYGIKLLTTKDGRYTNALVGFLNILLRLESAEHPDEVAIAFDLKAPTFRHKMYDGYKAQRKGMPEELAAQLPPLKDLLGRLGYKMVTCEGFEADDILGTLAAACRQRGDECVIVTGDRDSFQLVGGPVRVAYEGMREKRVDEDAVRADYGVEPRQLIDVKSLMGDTSDNIPGVKGIGEKTALDLIRNFGSLEGVYQNLDDERIRKAVREKLARDKAQAEMSRVLAEIKLDAPIDTAPGAYARGPVDRDGVRALLAEYEMAATAAKLNLSGAAAPAEAPQPAGPAPAPLEGPLSGPVALCFAGGAVLLAAGDKAYTAAADSPHLLAVLTDGSCEKHCFDAKPFFRLAFEAGREAKNITFDAKLAAYLLNPAAAEYTVAHLAQEYGVQPAFASASGDAALLQPLCAALQQKCAEDGLTWLLDEMELPLAEVLANMEYRGILVDSEGLRAFGDELQKALAEELSAIYDIVGYEFNVNSPKQLGHALFEALGLPAAKKTKSKAGYSTNAEVLENLRGQSPAIDHILLYRTYQKLNSTYIEGLLKVVGPDGRVHSTFNQTETRTGRISSNEPNLQNIPVRTELGSRLRRYFLAGQGRTLLDADYSQIELRILAHMADDAAMQEAFSSGADIHRSTAAKMYHVAPEEVTPAQRSSAKAINFGIMYGKGAFSLGKELNVSMREAQDFIDTYLGTYPNVRDYMQDVIDGGRQKGYVSTMYGRRRYLPELNNANAALRAQGERMAMNAPIQGTAADVIKLAMVRVYRRMKAEGLQAQLILQVHDELIVECPEDEKERATAILGEEMLAAASLKVPLLADVHEGKTWYDAKG